MSFKCVNVMKNKEQAHLRSNILNTYFMIVSTFDSDMRSYALSVLQAGLRAQLKAKVTVL
jgi:hypothetical protein